MVRMFPAGRQLGCALTLLAGILVSSPQSLGAAPVEHIAQTDLSFSAAFPKPFYQKRGFPLVVTAVTFVAAATFTYFTAGAGAPAAATGVGSVASWIGGGGTGSYMAGLSTVGSWFGGNAMAGSAILNGASIALGGGTVGTATLAAKSAAVVSLAATVLDGVLVFQPADQAVNVRVRLEVPKALASGPVAELLTAYERNLKAGADAFKKDPKHYAALTNAGNLAIKKNIEDMTRKALHAKAIDIGNLTVLTVLENNLGDSQSADQLLRRIPRNYLPKRGYYDYLRSVIAIEENNTVEFVPAMRAAITEDPYAIEPVILHVSYLANFITPFSEASAAILQEALAASDHFDADKYSTPNGLATLDYRVGSIYSAAGQHDSAEYWFRRADKHLPIRQRYVGDTKFHQLINIGIATEVCAQGRLQEANELLADIRKRADKSMKADQFAPCKRAMG